MNADAISAEEQQKRDNVYHLERIRTQKYQNELMKEERELMETHVQKGVEVLEKLIGEFGMDKYDQALFTPDADKTDADLGLK